MEACFRCFDEDHPSMPGRLSTGSDVTRAEAFSSRKPRTFMFYVVCDVSRSMWDHSFGNGGQLPYDVLGDALPEVLQELDDNEQVRDIGRISIISFSDQAQVVVPLKHLRTVKAVP